MAFKSFFAYYTLFGSIQRTFLSLMNHVRLVAGNAEYDVQFIFTGSSLLYLSLPANIIGGVCGSSVKKKNYKLFFNIQNILKILQLTIGRKLTEINRTDQKRSHVVILSRN